MNNNYTFEDYIRRFDDAINGKQVIFNLIIYNFMNTIPLSEFDFSDYLIRNITERGIHNIEELLCTNKGIMCMSQKDLKSVPLKIMRYQYDQLSTYEKEKFLEDSLKN